MSLEPERRFRVSTSTSGSESEIGMLISGASLFTKASLSWNKMRSIFYLKSLFCSKSEVSPIKSVFCSYEDIYVSVLKVFVFYKLAVTTKILSMVEYENSTIRIYSIRIWGLFDLFNLFKSNRALFNLFDLFELNIFDLFESNICDSGFYSIYLIYLIRSIRYIGIEYMWIRAIFRIYANTGNIRKNRMIYAILCKFSHKKLINLHIFA